ncbi:MAG TPA: 16S rRNA (guanine(966)-N(2))-methyltransferase RsmD [Pseudomonadota bacterium]|jgi:16S rRNA (guanine966-N2)-methyltransferase|nr:16S rRNA (guanine(966)-N(2))-methyltransferase RsmD [Pseudomonadota bacterium]HNN53322.1 16S rRNA (guanine(966)-N(2))-methyltransferase RsmD [Pseudomonadota bacterium]HNO69836.1 16S rRNA (guanine(966)-N(2))-methyltransferase RsmD [Pseudomonadota bacterium]
MIRIVAGELGGRRLRTPAGLSTRPTSERVRESLFNILGPIPDGAIVWDLCAGSGALGIEALSRGAGQALFVDQDASACRVLRRNLQDLGLVDRSKVIEAPLGRFLASQQRTSSGVDLLLADPPYASGELARLLDFLAQHGAACLRMGAQVVIETDVRQKGELAIGARRGPLLCTDVRRYGDTVLLFWQRSADCA